MRPGAGAVAAAAADRTNGVGHGRRGPRRLGTDGGMGAGPSDWVCMAAPAWASADARAGCVTAAELLGPAGVGQGRAGMTREGRTWGRVDHRAINPGFVRSLAARGRQQLQQEALRGRQLQGPPWAAAAPRPLRVAAKQPTRGVPCRAWPHPREAAAGATEGRGHRCRTMGHHGSLHTSVGNAPGALGGSVRGRGGDAAAGTCTVGYGWAVRASLLDQSVC